MSAIQPIQGTPKEMLRAIRIFYFAIITGALVFAVAVIAVNKGKTLSPDMKINARIILYVAVSLAAVCVAVAFNGYKKGMAPAKDSIISLQDKLTIYRTALIRYAALCEGPVIFSIIAFFLTGNYYLLVVAGVMIAVILLKTPTRQRITDELALDWQQQQEL